MKIQTNNKYAYLVILLLQAALVGYALFFLFSNPGSWKLFLTLLFITARVVLVKS